MFRFEVTRARFAPKTKLALIPTRIQTKSMVYSLVSDRAASMRLGISRDAGIGLASATSTRFGE
jgi:hypothetical protein